jgi:hypothetical protein
MLNIFKSFDADRMDIDEMVALVAFGETLRVQYEKLQLDEPEFVSNQLRSLKHEIKTKRANALASRRKQIKAQLETLKTPTQKKTDLEKELKGIDAVLVED